HGARLLLEGAGRWRGAQHRVDAGGVGEARAVHRRLLRESRRVAAGCARASRPERVWGQLPAPRRAQETLRSGKPLPPQCQHQAGVTPRGRLWSVAAHFLDFIGAPGLCSGWPAERAKNGRRTRAMDIDALPIARLGRETIRELSQRSDARGALQLGMHAGLLAATGLLVWASRGYVWLALALILHGIVVTFLFCA